VLASKTVILLPILSIDSLNRLAFLRIFGKLFSKELSFYKTSFKVISVLTTRIGGTPTKLSIKVHASRAGVPRKLPPARVLMTHKYRGCIVVLLINKSVEPNEEQKVLMSGFDQEFTVNTSKQVFRGIW
jgi:hypothetical protein